MNAHTNPSEPPEWVQGVKARGLGGALSLALDVLEPFGPLAGQAVFVAQPLLGVFLSRQALGDIAQHLEEPGGVERLRQYLDDET